MAVADIRLTFGAMFVGCVISVFLSGLGTFQTYQYFRHYRTKDSRIIVSMVLAVSLLDHTHTIFISQGVWNYLVLNWGNNEELDILIWNVGASVAITGIVTIIVQLFFTYRVWRFSKYNIYLGVLITSMAVVRLGSALATTVEMIRLGHFSTFIDDFRWLFTFGLALSCAIDILLTSSLCYYLQVNRAGHSTMDESIHRLFMYTISNGLLTTLTSLLTLLFAILIPHSFLFISLHFIIVKCYVNSLLATLNARDALKKRNDSNPAVYQISVEGHSQPRFRRFTPDSNERGIPLSNADDFASGHTDGLSVADVKVHVHVEQEVHHSDAEIGRESSPERNYKAPALSPSDEEVHATLNLPRDP